MISDIINPEMIIESILKGFMIVLTPLIPYLKSALIGTVSISVVVLIGKLIIDYWGEFWNYTQREKAKSKRIFSDVVKLIFSFHDFKGLK